MNYGGALGLVRYRDNTILPNFLWNKKDLSEQLLLNGLAAVYRQGGAQYDGSIDRWNALEKKAIRARKGIWKNGEKKAELPSDYKKAGKEKARTKSRQFAKLSFQSMLCSLSRLLCDTPVQAVGTLGWLSNVICSVYELRFLCT